MGRRSRLIVRHLLATIWAVLLGSLILLVSASHVAPFLGQQVFIVRGSSMSPTIPLGSLVAARAIAPDAVAAGDIVTMRLPSGTVVTHRVVRTVDTSDGLALETRGDANQASDGGLIPAAAVIGVVDAYVPMAGYILGMLSMPSGLVSIISTLGSLLLAIWLLDDMAAAERKPAAVPAGRLGEAGA
jgi:signal peptidase I